MRNDMCKELAEIRNETKSEFEKVRNENKIEASRADQRFADMEARITGLESTPKEAEEDEGDHPE